MTSKTLVELVLAVAMLSGCASSNYNQQSPYSWQSESSKAESGSIGIKTPALRNLKNNKSYIVLINIYEDVKKLSKLVGFSGSYGHIEVVRNGRAYGCRPPECSEIPLEDLERRFSNKRFEVREVDINGDPEIAIRWFRQNLEGQGYDLLYRNCTDAVAGMYDASGDRTIRVNPVDVDEAYATNAALRRFMAEYGIPKPNRATVFFPDQFTSVGNLVAKGTFVGR